MSDIVYAHSPCKGHDFVATMYAECIANNVYNGSVKATVKSLLIDNSSTIWDTLQMPWMHASVSSVSMPMQGHAFEARLYAESVANNFLPATGTVRRWQVPANASFFDNSSTVRIDSGVSEGDAVCSCA